MMNNLRIFFSKFRFLKNGVGFECPIIVAVIGFVGVSRVLPFSVFGCFRYI